jgi:hypothetical protein
MPVSDILVTRSARHAGEVALAHTGEGCRRGGPLRGRNSCSRIARGLKAMRGHLITQCFSEPTLAEVLSDPLVMEVMASDGVDPIELEAALADLAGNIRRREPQRKCRRA